MATFSFETMEFMDEQDKIRVNFLKIFYFYLDKQELNKISSFTIEKNSITLNDVSEAKASNKLNFLLFKGFQNLINKITKKRTVYIHKNSNIPLIGNIGFGILDRGSNIIEVRPVSGCNIRCVYCSVNDDARISEYVVEKDYLVEELRKLVEFKNTDKIEAHIAAQGEPTLYFDLVNLIKDIRNIPQVETISIDTNGTILTPKYVDELIDAGLTRFNFSLNAIDKQTALKIADAPYNHDKVIDIIKYISTRCELIIAPVFVHGFNDEELDKIIEFTKSLKNERFQPKIFIQNFLNYRFGRNPAKQVSFEEFYEILKRLEQKHKVKLIIDQTDFNIVPTKTMPKPFKKDDIVQVEIVDKGRLKGEMIGVSNGRAISIFGADKKGRATVKITRTKHNIFFADFIK